MVLSYSFKKKSLHLILRKTDKLAKLKDEIFNPYTSKVSRSSNAKKLETGTV